MSLNKLVNFVLLFSVLLMLASILACSYPWTAAALGQSYVSTYELTGKTLPVPDITWVGLTGILASIIFLGVASVLSLRIKTFHESGKNHNTGLNHY